MAKVSVCLPTYNGDRFLAQAIDSVLQQTFADLELLIVDDNSTDNSLAIANDYAVRDARVRVKRNRSNLGLFTNYNKCMELATGEFIKPFAQDDLLHPSILGKQIEALNEQDDVKLVSTAKRLIGPDGEELRVVRPFSESRTVSGRDVIRYNMLQITNWVGEPSTVMFRRADAGAGFDTRFYHLGDIEYWFRIVENGSYKYIDEPLCDFRRHSQSTTSVNLAGLYFALDVFLLGEKYRNYCEELGESGELFSRRAVEMVARHLDYLVKDEGVNLEQILSIHKGTPEQQSKQSDQFRELSFHALRYITKLVVDCHALRCTVTDLTEMVDDVRKNRFWNLTRPLRQITGEQVSGIDPDVPKLSSGKPCPPGVYHRENT